MLQNQIQDKQKEKETFPTCLTFEKEQKVRITDGKQEAALIEQNQKFKSLQQKEDSKPELRFLDQRREIKLIERKKSLYVIELNTLTMDVISNCKYIDTHSQLFSGSFFGVIEQPSDSEFISVFGTDSIATKVPNEMSYSVKILNTSKNLESKIRKISRKDKREDKLIAHGVISADSQVCMFIFEDGYTVIFKGSNFCTTDDFREYNSVVIFRANQLHIQNHENEKNQITILYANEEGVFLIEKARIDAFEKSREGANLYKGKILNLLYEQKSTRAYLLEQGKEEIWIVNFDLEKKTVLSSVRLGGEIRACCLLNDQLFVYVYQTTAKNLITKEDAPPSNHLFIYDMQNRYIAFKQIKGSLKIYSVCASDNAFYYVIQSAPDTESKTLIKVQSNTNQEKMNKFLEKSFFEIGYRFAENSGLKELLPKICSLAGEHYYKMKNYELAVKNFKDEIELIDSGKLNDYEFDPNSVITKFLDVSRMPYLIEYLYALHFSGRNLVNEYHQQLLVYCYLKKEMHKELNSWLSRMQKISSASSFEKTVSLVVSSCL